MQLNPKPAPEARLATMPLMLIAGGVTLLHLLTNSRYGFHRDELQFLSDAHHLDWGFVAYPPFTPLVEYLSMGVFGLSMVGLRLGSVVFQAAAILIAGLMARELGGGRLAQVAAAFTVALSPLPLFEGTEFQYSSFDYLWWSLVAYFIVRLLKSEDPRWWIPVGVTLGLGLETKYSILFLICGIIGGLILTRNRRYFLAGWFWTGVAVAFLLFLPNLLWQLHHDMISYHFLQHIHARDVRLGRSDSFLKDQFLICVNLAAAPVWIAGLVGYLRSSRYRMMAWMYIIPLALFLVGKGRGYYLAAAYPMLLAMGSATAEQWLQPLPRLGRRSIELFYFTAVAAFGMYICAIILPLAPDGPLRAFALAKNGDLREEIGWDELVKTVASVRDSLPEAQRQSLGIVVDNYGEQGAIEILGPTYHLPPPISTVNSAWLRGYPNPAPTTFITLGMNESDVKSIFSNCRLAAHNTNSLGIKNEESTDHPDIFVCGPPWRSWPELWKGAINFG